MFQSKKPKSHKFCLCTDASHDTRCPRALNTQFPRVIVDGAIHHGLVMDGLSFGQNQWNFLLTHAYHTHWLRSWHHCQLELCRLFTYNFHPCHAPLTLSVLFYIVSIFCSGVVLTFLVTPLLMLITSLSFVTLAPITLTCHPLKSLQLINEVCM